jgi:hypothetical protein
LQATRISSSKTVLMKSYLKRVVIGLALASIVQIMWAVDNRAFEVYPWLDDLEQAREIATEQGKPMLIVFRCVP